jgi:hypothetical protein
VPAAPDRTGVHAEKLAEAIEEDCVRFAQQHPVVEASVGFLTPVKGFTLEASSAYEPLYEALAIRAILGEDALTDMEMVLDQVTQARN